MVVANPLMSKIKDPRLHKPKISEVLMAFFLKELF